MSTTISNSGLPPQLPAASGNPGNGAAAATADTAAGTGSSTPVARGSDQVKLTDSARALQQAARADGGSAIDTRRVEQIRAAIASGSYQVNPGNIADRLISLDSQLGGTGKA